MKKFLRSNIIAFLLTIFLIFLIILSPQSCINGAKRGLLLCADIIIPSLFPFTVCVLFIMRLNILHKLRFIRKISKKIFLQSEKMFFTMLLSMIGGYPVGAKLIEEQLKNGEIDKTQAQNMLFYCVNAGPAFIAVAVGKGVLNSKEMGYLLLASHISASLIIAFFIPRFFKKGNFALNVSNSKGNTCSVVDNFVFSVADAAQSIIKICSFVIIFSVINSYIASFSEKLPSLKYLIYLSEVTYAVRLTKNAPLISFLLGFSGLCICCQVLSILGKYGIKAKLLIAGRIIHGLLSASITLILLKIFKLPIQTITNNLSLEKIYTKSGFHISISLVIMVLLLLISIFSKKHSGKKESNMV